MKKYFLASVALALSLGVAHAGEANFDGAYGGVQGAYSRIDGGDVDLDGFGGGAHVLDLASGETVDWIYTDGWLAETIADAGDRI